MALTPAAPAHSERIIKKSRFIGCVQPMSDRAGAQKVVAALWAQHPGARHVCWGRARAPPGARGLRKVRFPRSRGAMESAGSLR